MELIWGVVFVITHLLVYMVAWAHGRSSGKVSALEAAHGIDLTSGGRDE